MKIYNTALRLLSIAEIYGKELLKKYMLKSVKNETLREKIADVVIDKLVWKYPDHSFAIRRDELRDWFFNVENEEDHKMPKELWISFKNSIGGKPKKIIKFL